MPYGRPTYYGSGYPQNRNAHVTTTFLQEKKFAECKDREGCIDYYTKSAYESLSPKENYFRELKDCTPEKCVKQMRCYDTTGCGDFYSALPTDKLPQGVFKTEDAEKCKTECKKYVHFIKNLQNLQKLQILHALYHNCGRGSPNSPTLLEC